MPAKPSAALYRKQFAKRMKEARLLRRFSQAEMARALVVELETYKKWEQRGNLPTYLIEAFALSAREDVFYMLTGRREKSEAEPSAPSEKRRRISS